MNNDQCNAIYHAEEVYGAAYHGKSHYNMDWLGISPVLRGKNEPI